MRCVDNLINDKGSETNVLSELKIYYPLFGKLTPQTMKMLFTLGKLQKLEPSQILFQEKIKEYYTYLIIYGKVIIIANQREVLGTVKQGESVGEESIMVPGYKCR